MVIHRSFSIVSDFTFYTKGLITNYGEGGATKHEVLPLQKGGAEKVLAMLKGRHKMFWSRFYAVA